ncbi:hypothetical protein B0J17DRAFT_772565 [Rhizoctonia solani]|nr:hypothetical protein B0J17DRAFT_772565 [Rhizoctonia solani]
MPAPRDTVAKYGKKLNGYLLGKGPPQSRSQIRIVSGVQIMTVLSRFSAPASVTYETLEIILAMERYPESEILLVLLDKNLRFLPKCIGLLRSHCTEGARKGVCLKEIGGFKVSDALFLIEQLWISRKEFLYASAWGAAHFPGWSGLLHMLWNTALQTGESGSVSSPVPTVQNLRLVALVDIVCRYSLTILDENEIQTVVLITEDEKFQAIVSNFDKSIAMDAVDSQAITHAYSTNFKSIPGPRAAKYLDNHLASLSGYPLNNIDPTGSELSNQISQEGDDRSWGSILGWSADGLGCLLKLLDSSHRSKTAILTILTSVELCELFGRLILFPLTQDGRTLLGDSIHKDDATGRKMLIYCFKLVAAMRSELKFEVNPDAILSWNMTNSRSIRCRVATDAALPPKLTRSGLARDMKFNNTAAGDAEMPIGCLRRAHMQSSVQVSEHNAE